MVVLGKAFSGKTTMIRTLADVITELEGNIQCQFIYPKSVTFEQLYGSFNELSEWRDGILTKFLRQFCLVMNKRDYSNWIVCDGTMDEICMENLYSLLDNEKKMCLSSGEILHVPDHVSIIFETSDLSGATPTIVSRWSIAYIQFTSSHWKDLCRSWIDGWNNKKWLDGNRDFVLSLIEWMLPKCLDLLKVCTAPLISRSECHLAKTFITLIEIYMDTAYEINKDKEDNVRNVLYWIQATFVFAGLWTFGGTLNTDGRHQFDVSYNKLWNTENGDDKNGVLKVETILPQIDSYWFEYVYLFRGRGKWLFLSEYLQDQKIHPTHQTLVVPCVEQYIYSRLIELHLTKNCPILLIGPTGTGKTFYMNNVLTTAFDREKYIPSAISLNRNIRANQLQDFVLAQLCRQRGGIYLPARKRMTVIFIDDLNVSNEGDQQSSLELLRQLLNDGQWYDLKDATSIYLRNIVVAGATRSLKTKQEISSRLLHHFSVFALNDLTEESIKRIYTATLLFELKRNGFPSDIASTVEQIVSATFQLYQFARKVFKATVLQPHYKFNLRDFSRVIHGCARFRKESADNENVFAQLWMHESLRIFSDRLTNQADKTLVYENINFTIHEVFDEGLETNLKNLIFTPHSNKGYEPITIKALHDATILHLENYNAVHNIKLELHLFDAALRHLAHIRRILSMRCGNCLLVGVSGSGRQSLAKLAAFTLDFAVKEPQPILKYGTKEWRDDLKNSLKTVGIHNQDSAFILTQFYLDEKTLMEDVDLILSQGEFLDIFQSDERQQILESVRESLVECKTFDISPIESFDTFKCRCQEKFHIIICVSSLGSQFRHLLNSYPSLINNCTIDWFDDWPTNVLVDVSNFIMKDMTIEENIRGAVIDNCTFLHNTMKDCQKNGNLHITPSSYLNLLQLYRKLMQEKTLELVQKERHLFGGLHKLDLASKRAVEMEQSLDEFKPQLKELRQNAVRMNKAIAQENSQVEKASALVRADEKMANAQAAEAQRLKSECETELAQAIPILEDAILALNTLKPTDITLVKSMKNPPDAIKLVMAAVCVMKGVKPDRIPDPSTGKRIVDFWGPSKRVLGDMAFLQQLKDYDKDDIKEEIMTKIRSEYISNKDFKPEIVANASSAAEGLCKWVIAMDKYDAVAKEVAPKREKLEIAELKYATTAKVLKEKKDQLATLEKSLANLNVTLAKATARQRFLQNSVDLCESKLYRAEKLLANLSNEKGRWTIELERLQEQRVNLYGDMLISAGFIGYLGMFTLTDRQKIVEKWCTHIRESAIPFSFPYNVCDFFSPSLRLKKCSDTFFMENELIIRNSIRYCLLLDVQLEGSKWLQSIEKHNNIITIEYSHKDLLNSLEYCIKNGVPLLIEGATVPINPALHSIFYKQVYIHNDIHYINVSSKAIAYNGNFRLYLTNHEIKPSFTVETFNKVTMVDFQVNVHTLKDITLKTLTKIENPELYRDWKRSNLTYYSGRNEIVVKNDDILRELTETEDVLDNAPIIEKICDCSNYIRSAEEKLTGSLKELERLEKCRENYRVLAEYCATLYYCISLLCKIDPMYRYSSLWFMKLLKHSIDEAQRSQNVISRLNFLKIHFTYNLYKHIAHSLYKEHYLVFSFLLYLITCNIGTSVELDFLLKSSGDIIAKNNYLEWLDDKAWMEVVRLSELEGFSGLTESVVNESEMWKEVYDQQDGSDVRLPEEWEKRLSDWQKLLIIKALRSRDLYDTVEKLVRDKLGTGYVFPPPFDLAESYAQSSKTTPLLFLLSTNYDPTAAITEFSQTNHVSYPLKIVSLYNGNDSLMVQLIENARQDGGWICVENCHLTPSCFAKLSEFFAHVGTTSTHPNFRLWLTTRPSPSLPVYIVQNSIKITMEQRIGIREGMSRAYSVKPVSNAKFFRISSGKEMIFTKLVYSLAFFHAKIQGRVEFFPRGWSIPYYFSDGDFSVAAQELQCIINGYGDPFVAIDYAIMQCNYGAHIVNDWDYRLLQCIFRKSVNSQGLRSSSHGIANQDSYYQCPKQAGYVQIVNHIRTIPVRSPFELYGFHDSVLLEYRGNEAEKFLDNFRTAFGISEAWELEEQIIKVETMAESLLARLPTELETKFGNCMDNILQNEFRRYSILLRKIRRSLKNVIEACQDSGFFTKELETLAASVLLNNVPLSWLHVSYPTLKSLTAYFDDLLERICFFDNWAIRGRPTKFWLSAFFSSNAFLTDIKLCASRKLNLDYDMVTFDYQIGEGIDIYGLFIDVYGLFIDGARWNKDTNSLSELLPKQRYDMLPLLQMSVIFKENLVIGRRFVCPLYKTLLRDGECTNMGIGQFVLPVILNSDLEEDECIERGIALVCQLNA